MTGGAAVNGVLLISILSIVELFASLNLQSEASVLSASPTGTVTFVKNILINKGTTIPLQRRFVATTNNAVSSGARVHRGHSAP